mgnify:CR=1 FL=1
MQAFVLTAGTTHYRSINRGETWQSFKTALAPSLSANTLSFHARKWDWILFTGQSCDDAGGWQGRVCHDEVSRGWTSACGTRAAVCPSAW